MKLADLPQHLVVIARAMFNNVPAPADNPVFMQKNKKKDQEKGNSFVKISGDTYAMANSRHDAKLGKGSYGKAVLAKNTADKYFTIKIAKILDDSTKYEADVGSLLGRVFGVGERISSKGVKKRYIVQEYIQGEDLYGLLYEKETCLDDYLKLTIFYNICLDLKFMHDRRVIHGDLQPANVIVNLNSDPIDVRIIDFGLSKRLPDESQVVFAEGLSTYLAPELKILGDVAPFSTCSDIYALGVIATKDLGLAQDLPLTYSMLQSLPWDRPSLTEIILACEQQLNILKSIQSGSSPLLDLYDTDDEDDMLPSSSCSSSTAMRKFRSR